MPMLSPAAYAFAGTAKPVLVAALVTGAGLTAFATPLSDTAAKPRMSAPSIARVQFAAVAATSKARPVVAPDTGVAEALDPVGPGGDRHFAAPGADPAAEPTGLPGVAPIDFVLEGEVETAAIAPGTPRPAVGAPARPGYMPAAELKAMMAGVAASRGDLDGLARPELSITVASADAPPASEHDAQAGEGIDFEAPALVNGLPAGRLPLRITGGESISVRLGDVLGVLQPLLDGPTYRALTSSEAAGEYVSFDRLRASGIAVRFDAQDRVVFGSS